MAPRRPPGPTDFDAGAAVRSPGLPAGRGRASTLNRRNTIVSDDVTPLEIEDIQKIFDASPFISHMQMKAESVDHAASTITCSMPLLAHMERREGTQQFHGGPIASFIDTVGDFAIGMLVGGGVPTINLRIDYLKPAVGESLKGVATVRRRGRSVAIIDVDVMDAKGALVAVGRGTYSPNRG